MYVHYLVYIKHHSVLAGGDEEEDNNDDSEGGRGEKGNKDSISSEICNCPAVYRAKLLCIFRCSTALSTLPSIEHKVCYSQRYTFSCSSEVDDPPFPCFIIIHASKPLLQVLSQNKGVFFFSVVTQVPLTSHDSAQKAGLFVKVSLKSCCRGNFGRLWHPGRLQLTL